MLMTCMVVEAAAEVELLGRGFAQALEVTSGGLGDICEQTEGSERCSTVAFAPGANSRSPFAQHSAIVGQVGGDVSQVLLSIGQVWASRTNLGRSRTQIDVLQFWGSCRLRITSWTHVNATLGRASGSCICGLSSIVGRAPGGSSLGYLSDVGYGGRPWRA